MSFMLRSRVRWFVLASISGSTGALGCSSGSSSCVELATCGATPGDAGVGGAPNDVEPPGGTGSEAAAGAGGDGEISSDPVTGGQGGDGGAGALGCRADADCDDQLGCSGLERCVDGECQAGEPVECASEAAGCESVCTENRSGPRCVTRAADADGDGQGSSTCAEDRGEDCDDDDPTVYAGAPELCDALDNDCDAIPDLSDGLRVDAEDITLEGYSPSVVWSESHAAFGVMWIARDDGASQLRGGTLSTAGVVRAWPVNAWSSTTTAYLSPVLIDDGSGFAAVYQTGNRGGQLAHFAAIDGEGNAQTRQLDALHTDIAHREGGGFSLAGEAAGALRTQALLPDGTSASSTFEAFAAAPRIAAVGGTEAVIWQPKGAGTVEGLLFRGASVPTPLRTIQGASPDITAAGDDYAVAWSSPTGVVQQRLALDGSWSCAESEVAFNVSAPSERAVAIASTGEHVLVLVTDPLERSVRLLRFDRQCRLFDEADLDNSAVAPSRPAIAVGGGHVAVCWSEGTSEDQSECRVMGVELCEGGAAAPLRSEL